jgi:zinc/manganese transport system substrate-binding protein
VVTATKSIKSRQMEEDEHNKTRKITDPHAWQSLASGKIYVHNIRDGLIAADPAGKDTTRRTPVKFLVDIEDVEKTVKDSIAKLPPAAARSSHDAFGYFGATYGMEFIARKA